jgi:hypothetical protein
MRYTDIKTFEDACKALNLNPVKVIPDVTGLPQKHQAAVIAHTMLIIIIEAANEGWVPDWNNEDERKYEPWFDMESGFSLNYVFASYASSVVGSRLCFRSREVGEYIVSQFLELYKTYFTYN